VLILEVYYRYVTPLLTYRPKSIEPEEVAPVRPASPARLRVVAIRARSTAARIGLKIGDEISGYAGKRVVDTIHLKTLIREHRERDAVALEVSRGGRVLRMTVPGGALGVTVEERDGG
jgi:S1-C subfamily serine protease